MSQHHSFDIHIATIYGIDDAIIIHHFQHWIRINKKLRRGKRNGKTWTYQTRQEIAAHFPYFTIDQVRRICERLVENNILLTSNYNKSGFDKTLWYAFVDEEKFVPDIDDSDEIKIISTKGKSATSSGKSATSRGEFATPIPDTKNKCLKTDIKKPTETASQIPESFEPKFHDQDLEVAKHLFRRVNENIPKTKPPKLEKWAHQIRIMREQDALTWDEMHSMIDWAHDHSFWYQNVRSPDGLRNNYLKMEAQRSPPSNAGTNMKKNKNLAYQVRDYLNKNGKNKLVGVYNEVICHIPTGDTVGYDIPYENFEHIIYKWAGIEGKKDV